MNKFSLLITLVLIILVSGVGFFFFKDYFPNFNQASETNPQRALFEKIVAKPQDIEKYKTEIQKLATQVTQPSQSTQSAQARTFINLANCTADPLIVKIYKDESMIVKNNSKKTADLNINGQILNMKTGQSYETGQFKAGNYLYECKEEGGVLKKSGVLYVEDKYSPQYQSLLENVDNFAKAKLALGFDPTLVEKLRIYNIHDYLSKEFKDTLEWVRNNAKESSQIIFTNCRANSDVIKITSQEFTITNNDISEINVVSSFASEGIIKIPAKQSVKQKKLLTNSVLTFSCNNQLNKGQGVGFIYFQ